MGEQVDAAALFSQRRRAKAKSEVRKQVQLAEQWCYQKLNNKGLQLSRLERTPDKREVGGSSPLKPMHCFLSEDERKRSLRLENKYTLRSEAEQWCYHKRFHVSYSFGEDERCWSSNLQISLLRQKALTMMYLENCIPNEKLYKYFIIRHPRYQLL